jgi:hypothetical protein
MRAALRFINLLLSGSLPRSSFVLQSVMVGLQKLTDGAPIGGVRPIAIGEAWYRLAMLCALTDVGAAVGPGLAPVQVEVGARGGVDAVAHAIATALEADPLAVACAVDCENAFNTVSRAAVFAAVQIRMPQLLPVVQWAYGASTPLHVAGAPPDSEPILSRCGVRCSRSRCRACWRRLRKQCWMPISLRISMILRLWGALLLCALFSSSSAAPGRTVCAKSA